MSGGHKASWEMESKMTNETFNRVITKLTQNNDIKKYGIFAKFGKRQEFDSENEHYVYQPVYIRDGKGNSARVTLFLPGNIDFNKLRERFYFKQVAGHINDVETTIISKLEQVFKKRLRRF